MALSKVSFLSKKDSCFNNENPLVGMDVSLMEFALHNQCHKIKTEMRCQL